MTNFDLINGGSSKENDLCESSMWKRAKTDTAYNLEAPLDDSKAARVAVVDQARDVLARHLGQLLLEERLETCEEDKRTRLAIVLNRDNLNETFA